MQEGNHDFHLSAKELEFLRQLASRDKSLAELLGLRQSPGGRSTTIRLARGEAEQIRGYLTTELAAVGFDENYEPNDLGRMLETLIDRFYLR